MLVGGCISVVWKLEIEFKHRHASIESGAGLQEIGEAAGAGAGAGAGAEGGGGRGGGGRGRERGWGWGGGGRGVGQRLAAYYIIS